MLNVRMRMHDFLFRKLALGHERTDYSRIISLTIHFHRPECSWVNETMVKPRSNGTAFNKIPPITDANSLYLFFVVFFVFVVFDIGSNIIHNGILFSSG